MKFNHDKNKIIILIVFNIYLQTKNDKFFEFQFK